MSPLDIPSTTCKHTRKSKAIEQLDPTAPDNCRTTWSCDDCGQELSTALTDAAGLPHFYD